jgi:hypothetical protein
MAFATNLLALLIILNLIAFSKQLEDDCAVRLPRR